MCNVCRKNPCDTSCPNFETLKSNHFCSICKEFILIGEEYIENDLGKCAHWDCLDTKYELLKFLDYEIMEDLYEG